MIEAAVYGERMGRKQIRDIRHEELIDATIAAIHRCGYATVTINQIASEANASAGSIHYYFGNKEKLLEATMRRLLGILERATLDRLAGAETPRDRLIAILAANFDDSLFSTAQCSVWMQFWANAPYEASLARLQRINRTRVRSNLRAELKNLLPAETRETARRALQAYMDGVWLQAAQSAEQLDPAKARQQITELADMLINSSDKKRS